MSELPRRVPGASLPPRHATARTPITADEAAEMRRLAAALRADWAPAPSHPQPPTHSDAWGRPSAHSAF